MQRFRDRIHVVALDYFYKIVLNRTWQQCEPTVFAKFGAHWSTIFSFTNQWTEVGEARLELAWPLLYLQRKERKKIEESPQIFAEFLNKGGTFYLRFFGLFRNRTNLVPRVLRLLGQRAVAGRVSGVPEFSTQKSCGNLFLVLLQWTVNKKWFFFVTPESLLATTRWPRNLRTLGTKLKQNRQKQCC